MTDNPDETLPVEQCDRDALLRQDVFDRFSVRMSIRDAIADPASIVGDRHGGEGWTEDEAHWQARAAIEVARRAIAEHHRRAAQSPPPVVSEGVEHDLLELLAVIHRDGGHYVEQHGIKKAVADAMQLSSERLSSPSRGCDAETVEATKLCAEVEADAVSALRYIETHYGRLSGIGWDRVFDAHDRLFAMGRNLGKEQGEG